VLAQVGAARPNGSDADAGSDDRGCAEPRPPGQG